MAVNARRGDQPSSPIRLFPGGDNRVAQNSLGSRAHEFADGWLGLRGNVLTRQEVELVGGFPGSAVKANRFRRARLTISERWLIVNDGRADGFAVALDRIESMTVVPGSGRSRYGLQMRYLDGQEHRCFFIRFAEAVWPFRSGDDAVRIATLLTELGVEVDPIGPATNHRRLAMTSEEMRVCALETMVWSGELTGPIRGWLGQDRAACQAWLTVSSFIWRPVGGQGANCILLKDLISVTTGIWIDREPAQVVLMSLLDDAGDRHELPFVFNASRAIEENRRECAAMLGGLRMRDVPVASQLPPLQPWNGIGSLLAATDSSNMDTASGASRHHHAVSAGEFEAHCLIEIARLSRDIVGYSEAGGDIELASIGHVTQSSAMAELERRHAAGEIGRSALLDQRRRFNALIEARGKLAAIAAQRVQGTRPLAILLHQRDAVMTALNDVIVPDQSNSMHIELVQPRMHLRLLPRMQAQ